MNNSIHRLDLLCGSIRAGNTSNKVKKEARDILNYLHKKKRISNKMKNQILQNHGIM